jgi:hypothetical protein
MRKILKVLAFTVLLPLSIVIPAYVIQTISLDSHVYAQASTLQKRVDAYKKKLVTNPSQADLDRLKLRCSVAQNVLKNVQTRSTTAQQKRTEAYSNINKTLDELVVALKAKNIDTAKLEAQAKELKTKTATFSKTQEQFTLAVKDAAELKCSNDPLALKAAIEEARVLQTQLQTQSADIRTYITNVVKPSIKQIRENVVKDATIVPSVTNTTDNEEPANAAQ